MIKVITPCKKPPTHPIKMHHSIGTVAHFGGHSLLVVDGFRQYFGMYSYMLGAMCIAIGLFSRSTKIYLTILLMRHEGHDSKL